MNNRPLDTEAELTQLRELVLGLEKTSKMLVRRDIALRKAYDELKSLDREKTEFVSIAAHQLRTPVTSARWALKYLNEEHATGLNEAQQRLVRRAHEGIERSYQLVEELLELNRIDFGSITLRLQKGSLERLCEDVIKAHEQIPNKTPLVIQRDFDRTPREVSFDSFRLKDALDNLLDNAIKYNQDCKPVIVRTRYRDGKAVVEVEDHGIGVAKGDEEKIFRKFTRLGNAEQKDPNGTGLGLYVSRKIVEAHGGSITFHHNKPQGAKFSISIPW